MKPNQDFRLSKTTKRMLALMKTSEENRSLWKKNMIQAELAFKAAKLSKYKETKGE